MRRGDPPRYIVCATDVVLKDCVNAIEKLRYIDLIRYANSRGTSRAVLGDPETFWPRDGTRHWETEAIVVTVTDGGPGGLVEIKHRHDGEEIAGAPARYLGQLVRMATREELDARPVFKDRIQLNVQRDTRPIQIPATATARRDLPARWKDELQRREDAALATMRGIR